MKLSSILFRSSLKMFFIGAVPYWLVILVSGLEGLEKYLNGLIVPEEVIYYPFVAYVMWLSFWVANYYSHIHSSYRAELIEQIINAVRFVATSFITLLQFLSGVFVAFIVSWFWLDPNTTFNLAHIALMLFTLKVVTVTCAYCFIDEVFTEKFSKKPTHTLFM